MLLTCSDKQDSICNWISFFIERVPIIVLVPFSIGISWSTSILVHDSFFDLKQIVIASLYILMYFVMVRFIDEYKDVEKDKIGNPLRPIPSGRISEASVLRWIYVFFTILMCFTVSSFIEYRYALGTCSLALLLFTVCFYKQFFIHWPDKFFIVEVIVDQVSHLLLSLTVSCMMDENAYTTLAPYLITLLMLGSFFTFDVCRKLDPTKDPKLLTYLVLYGKIVTFFLIFTGSVVSFLGVFLTCLYMDYPFISVYISTFILCSILSTSAHTLHGKRVSHIPAILCGFNAIFNVFFICVNSVLV